MPARCKKPMYTMKYTDWNQVPLFLTITETCCLLRWSDESVRKRIKDGTLKAITTGGKFLITKDSIIALINDPMIPVVNDCV